MIENTIRDFTLLISIATEGFAALIVAAALIEAIWRLSINSLRRVTQKSANRSHLAKEEIRLRLGRWLTLALEFLLAADVLRTAVAPSWSEIGKLAAIAAIRTALNFFLQREVDVALARDRGADPAND